MVFWTSLAAGDMETFNKVKPVLETRGEAMLFHLGALGSGHVTKLVNNFIGMTTVATMSQAFAVAQRAGVDGQQLFDIMSAGHPNSLRSCNSVSSYAVDGENWFLCC